MSQTTETKSNQEIADETRKSFGSALFEQASTTNKAQREPQLSDAQPQATVFWIGDHAPNSPVIRAMNDEAKELHRMGIKPVIAFGKSPETLRYVSFDGGKPTEHQPEDLRQMGVTSIVAPGIDAQTHINLINRMTLELTGEHGNPKTVLECSGMQVAMHQDHGSVRGVGIYLMGLRGQVNAARLDSPHGDLKSELEQYLGSDCKVEVLTGTMRRVDKPKLIGLIIGDDDRAKEHYAALSSEQTLDKTPNLGAGSSIKDGRDLASSSGPGAGLGNRSDYGLAR